MTKTIIFLLSLVMMLPLAACAAETISASSTRGQLFRIRDDRNISSFLTTVASRAVKKFADKGLTSDKLGVTLIIDDPQRPRTGSFRGAEPFYPASVIKLCYAVALEQAFATGKLPREEATLRDLDYMITDSNNAATNRILDRLTGTESGPELGEAELQQFADKRNSVNRYLRELGFKDINANQKTWDDEPFGRDVQFLKPDYSNRNRMTTNETAKLVWLIKNEKVVSPEGCQEILRYMKRRPNNPKDIQARRIGAGIPEIATFWSKAGWTSNTNHDAAYVELPGDTRFVLTVFTKTSYEYPEIVAWIAREVCSGIRLGSIDPEWIGPRVGKGRQAQPK